MRSLWTATREKSSSNRDPAQPKINKNLKTKKQQGHNLGLRSLTARRQASLHRWEQGAPERHQDPGLVRGVSTLSHSDRHRHGVP